ncbi:hypothetical protein SBF1_6300003 [Candidatus Desulfosporosinus infrequens]|uniref:Uncharacterized protein n=1 Tax=Candidatus Desulfosporosinus infrequens TaxID=2043169 RepID=A0A2U3LME7_9FIRM|nr:hypothetical protein SBF1_6300003 [Candidatus Desulfosporosinus infrequens]
MVLNELKCKGKQACKCKTCFNNAHSGCTHCVQNCDGYSDEDIVKKCKAYIKKGNLYSSM